MKAKKAVSARTHSTAEEVCFIARHALDSSSPLFVLVHYRENQRRDEFVEELNETLSESRIETQIFDLAFGDDEPPFLYTELESLGEREVALVTRLPQAPGGLALDSDYLKYLNFHRDRMAFRRFRWVLFLHEVDIEQFQREAGDLWDFRQHTFWLDGEPAEPGERVWLNVERSIDGYDSKERLIEASPEEITKHCGSVRWQVEETAEEEEQAALLGDLAGWLLRRGAYEPALAVVKEALTKDSNSSRSQRAELEGLAGRALEGIGDLDAAAEHIRRQIELLAAQRDRNAEARAWVRLSGVNRARQQFEKAGNDLERAVKILDEMGDLKARVTGHLSLGGLFNQFGNLEKAGNHYQEALEIAAQLEDQQLIASAYHQLGIVKQKSGCYEEAQEFYRKSLDIAEEIEDSAKVANSYHQLGMLAQQRESYDEALKWYRKSLEIKERLRNPADLVSTYHQLGTVAEQRGSYAEALEWYRESLEIQKTTGDLSGIAPTLSQVGILSMKEGEPEDAVPLNLQSLAIRLEMGSPEARIDLHWLRRQREALGEDRFAELVTEHVGEDGAARVLDMVDEFEAASEASEE